VISTRDIVRQMTIDAKPGALSLPRLYYCGKGGLPLPHFNREESINFSGFAHAAFLTPITFSSEEFAHD